MSGWRKTPEQQQLSALRQSPQWQALRKLVITEEPYCRECGAPTTEIDHIQSAIDYPHRFLDRSNLQGLCSPCHHRKTGREHGRKSSRRNSEPHPGIITR